MLIHLAHAHLLKALFRRKKNQRWVSGHVCLVSLCIGGVLCDKTGFGEEFEESLGSFLVGV